MTSAFRPGATLIARGARQTLCRPLDCAPPLNFDIVASHRSRSVIGPALPLVVRQQLS